MSGLDEFYGATHDLDQTLLKFGTDQSCFRIGN